MKFPRFLRRKDQSPYSDDRLREPHHVGLILYEIKQLAGESIESETDHVRPRDESLRGIIYRAAYLLNYGRSPLIDGISEGMAQDLAAAYGRKLPPVDRDGREAFKRGRRDGERDRKRRAQWGYVAPEQEQGAADG